ncbi:MAG: hypothetical protein IPJ88_17020 [Myxococcales bacterium]|nr:MAG: hypothetical protein IPJ88_17020 [Myxococcales bacterium]
MHARKAVILAASALYTPVLLLQSGLSGKVGHHFRAHPGAPVVGMFDERIDIASGGTQSYEIPLRERGYKIESIGVPPELIAARIPGAGAVWQDRISRLDHVAQWAGLIHMEAQGHIDVGWGQTPKVSYTPSQADYAKAREAIALMCKMMFQVGAKEVYPGLGGVPEVITNPSQVELIEKVALKAQSFHLVASHLFGGAVAGADPAHSVVGPDLQCHDLQNLYAMDASVFPSNMGVNPQHSIMAIVYRAAERLANQTHYYQAA